jgi:hypothetical protein
MLQRTCRLRDTLESRAFQTGERWAQLLSGMIEAEFGQQRRLSLRLSMGGFSELHEQQEIFDFSRNQ